MYIRIMKKNITILLLILFATIAHATNQAKDILMLNGDTLFLYNSPLEQVDNISKKILNAVEQKYKSIMISSGCWRGFTAKWIVKNSTLYLVEVKPYRSKININKIVEQILGKKFHNGLLKADWVNGHFWCGKDLAPIMQLYISVYCNETKLNLKNGHVESIEKIKFTPCDYSNKIKREEFILSHINWSKLPEISNKSVELSAYVRNNQKGKIVSAEIEKSSDSRFNEEFLNAIRLLPCTTVYFNEGQFYDVGEDIDMTIDKSTQKNYAR